MAVNSKASLDSGNSRAIPSTAELSAIATEHGLDPTSFLQVMQAESSGQNEAANRFGYGGLFGLNQGDMQAAGYGSTSINDPTANANAAAIIMSRENAQFESATGHAPSATEQYMIHQQGLGGAIAIAQNPNAPLSQTLGRFWGGANGVIGPNGPLVNNITPAMRASMGPLDQVTGAQFMQAWGNQLANEPIGGGSNTNTQTAAVQQFLNTQGFNLATDGINGPQTKAAVEAFQQANGLTVDGVVGPQTLAAIQSVQSAGQGQQGGIQLASLNAGEPVPSAWDAGLASGPQQYWTPPPSTPETALTDPFRTTPTEATNIPAGPYGADQFAKALLTGDPDKIAAAQQALTDNVLNQAGVFGANAAKQQVIQYLTVTLPQAAPGALRDQIASLVNDPKAFGALSAEEQQYLQTAQQNLPPAPVPLPNLSPNDNVQVAGATPPPPVPAPTDASLIQPPPPGLVPVPDNAANPAQPPIQMPDLSQFSSALAGLGGAGLAALPFFLPGLPGAPPGTVADPTQPPVPAPSPDQPAPQPTPGSGQASSPFANMTATDSQTMSRLMADLGASAWDPTVGPVLANIFAQNLQSDGQGALAPTPTNPWDVAAAAPSSQTQPSSWDAGLSTDQQSYWTPPAPAPVNYPPYASDTSSPWDVAATQSSPDTTSWDSGLSTGPIQYWTPPSDPTPAVPYSPPPPTSSFAPEQDGAAAQALFQQFMYTPSPPGPWDVAASAPSTSIPPSSWDAGLASGPMQYWTPPGTGQLSAVPPPAAAPPMPRPAPVPQYPQPAPQLAAAAPIPTVDSSAASLSNYPTLPNASPAAYSGNMGQGNTSTAYTFDPTSGQGAYTTDSGSTFNYSVHDESMGGNTYSVFG